MIQLTNVFKYYRIDRHVKIILDHVSTVFESGSSYALLGVNGAGKSTTLRLIAGTELPNGGKIRRTVRVSWPLGLGSSFHPTVSGRDNLRFIARIYGADTKKVIRFVEDFAEIGDYLDAQVRTYSSGMFGRLAFAVSMAIDFDCYLIDEATSTGDAHFQARCEEVFAQRRKYADVIFVTHSMGTVKNYCNKGGVLVDGRIITFDTVDRAIDMYNKLNR
jgi:capsular polysaccharide transport system ATP-binding protein